MLSLPFFSKKKESSKGNAADRVESLSSQGFSESEIIRALRKEGYSPSEVDSAMKDSLKSAIGPPAPQRPGYSQGPARAPEPMGPPRGPPREPGLPELGVPGEEPPGDMQSRVPEGMPTADDFPPREGPMQQSEFPELPGGGRYSEQMMPERPIPTLGATGGQRGMDQRREVEELAEGIIEEKWAALENELKNIESRFRQMDTRINGVEEVMKGMKGVKKSEVEEIRVVIDSYKDSMSDISARMESIESAVKDSLTPMMQSLRSLSDTVRALKKK